MVRIGKDHCVTAFSPAMTPIAEVSPGETVLFETSDCWHGQIKSERQSIESVDFSSLNPATGPLRVNGAEPGDALAVEIVSIKTAPTGIVNVIPGAGVLGDITASSRTKILKIEEGRVIFGELSIEARPMIGVIGVATDAETVSTGTPGRHGGNMDTKDICEGSVLYLPVSKAGAMLALGDVHAVMGDGEVCVTGCETAAEVTVRVDVVRDAHITWPVIRKDGCLMIVVSAPSLDDAVTEATKAAVSYLSRACGISSHEAYMLASLSVDMRISQCVDPLKTVRAVIPYEALGLEGLILPF